jgi:hypothetical protein
MKIRKYGKATRSTSIGSPRFTGSSPKFTGTCPIREHTADGDYVGPCEHATYELYCPRHGFVGQFLSDDPSCYRSVSIDYSGADDRLLPRSDRTWPDHLKEYFGVK